MPMPIMTSMLPSYFRHAVAVRFAFSHNHKAFRLVKLGLAWEVLCPLPLHIGLVVVVRT